MLAKEYSVQIVWLECGECGAPIALTQTHYNMAKEGRRNWYCPNGHCRIFVETEATKLKKQLDKEKKRREWAEAQRDRAREHAEHETRRASAYKGHLTRTKKRVGNGVCPCCNRTFTNLGRHMQSKHPEYADAEVSGDAETRGGSEG